MCVCVCVCGGGGGGGGGGGSDEFKQSDCYLVNNAHELLNFGPITPNI